MKKILAMALSVAIIATIAISGTVAYFTDQKSATNTAVLGSVFITQYEQERTERDPSKLQDFTQDQQIVPAVIVKDDTSTPGDNHSEDVPQRLNVHDHYVTMPKGINNFVDKIVDVKNEGTSPAYIRTFIAVPLNSYKMADNDGWLHLALNDSDEFTWTQTCAYVELKNKDGKDAQYAIYVATYKEPIEAGKYTVPSLLGFYIDSAVDNEKDENGNIYYTFEDQKIDLSKLEIKVATQAVQSAGFTSAKDAFETSYSYMLNLNPWAEGLEDTEKDTETTGNAATLVSELNALRTADVDKTITLEKNAVYDFSGVEWTSISNSSAAKITIEGNGAVLRNMSAPLFGDVKATKLTIKNLTIDKAEMNNTDEAGNPAAGYGAFIQYIDNYINDDNAVIILDGCHLTNSKIESVLAGDIEGTYVERGDYVGGLIGYASHNNVEIKNCSVEGCTINGKASVGGIIGVRQGKLTVSDSSVKNCNLTSKKSHTWRVGAIIGTVNDTSTVTLKNCTSTNNNMKQNDGAVMPGTEQSNLYGRNAIVSSGSITIS